MSRSTLSDANTRRCAEVFTGLFARLVAQALPGLREKMREPLHLIDSTSFRLSRLSADWARFSATACGVGIRVSGRRHLQMRRPRWFKKWLAVKHKREKRRNWLALAEWSRRASRRHAARAAGQMVFLTGKKDFWGLTI